MSQLLAFAIEYCEQFPALGDLQIQGLQLCVHLVDVGRYLMQIRLHLIDFAEQLLPLSF